MTAPDNSPKSRNDLFAFLDQLGIAHQTREHRAVFTVDEGRDLKTSMPGGHTKNLFLKDKAGQYALAVAHADTRADLVALGKALGSKGRLSFGKPAAMMQILGVSPGSVTPFALINAIADEHSALGTIVLDKALFDHETLWFHPLENTASTVISSSDLITFVRSCGYVPHILDLAMPIIQAK